VLRDREAVAVELERARAIPWFCLPALHLPLGAPIAFGPLLLSEDGGESVAQLALPRPAVRLVGSHRYWSEAR
jgi:hypothetical protein